MSDGGFVLLDAVAASAIVAISGGVALGILANLLTEQSAVLDRSQETTNLEAFIQTIVMDWKNTESRSWSDGVFSYAATEVSHSEPVSDLVRVSVQSSGLDGQVISNFEIWVPR
jgi:type II secretory pathway component PulJ